MVAFDLLKALNIDSILLVFWFSLLLDVPRYLFTALSIAFVPHQRPSVQGHMTVSAVVACHNEERGLRACIQSLRGVEQIIVVDDGSTDGTWNVIEALVAEGLVHVARRLSERGSKPAAVNIGLGLATGEAVLILDSDTVILDRFAIENAMRYLLEDERVGGVGLNLRVRNENASLVATVQAIEYWISITVGKQISDAFGTLANVSGAAGLFRRLALLDVGGLDIEVAEDAALATKLRLKGWVLRFAPDSHALTCVPETMVSLLCQRMRWDSALVPVWLRRHFISFLSPFSPSISILNLLTTFDVVVYSILMPLVLPVYILWLYCLAGSMAWTILLMIMIGLSCMEVLIILLSQLPLRLLPYVPLYLVVQIAILRPARTLFVLAELVGHITHGDNYIPDHQRWRLS